MTENDDLASDLRAFRTLQKSIDRMRAERNKHLAQATMLNDLLQCLEDEAEKQWKEAGR